MVGDVTTPPPPLSMTVGCPPTNAAHPLPVAYPPNPIQPLMQAPMVWPLTYCAALPTGEFRSNCGVKKLSIRAPMLGCCGALWAIGFGFFVGMLWGPVLTPPPPNPPGVTP